VSFLNNKYQIVSTGCCGTHYIYEFLKKSYGEDNLNNIFMNHNIQGKGKLFNIDNDVKFIYLYRHPIDCVVSFYNKSKDYHKAGRFARRHCKNIKGNYHTMDKRWDVSQYFNNAHKDLYRFSRHYRKFMNNKKSYKFMYIKYEHFYKYINEFLHFLEIDDKFICDFKWKQGESSRHSLSKDDMIKAKKIYERAEREYDSYPEFCTNFTGKISD